MFLPSSDVLVLHSAKLTGFAVPIKTFSRREGEVSQCLGNVGLPHGIQLDQKLHPGKTVSGLAFLETCSKAL